MRVAVLGGGHGCYAAAAELSERGHEVWFWRRGAEAFAPVLDRRTIRIRDAKGDRDVAIAHPTLSLEEAIKSAELVVIPLPADTHEDLALACAPYWRDGQVVFLPPGTLGSILFLQAARAAGNMADVSFAETGTLPYLVRKHGPAEIVVSAYATRLPTGVFPSKNADHAFALLEQAYPAIERIEDGLSGGLMNAGPIIHPPLILMNAGPLEYFPAWDIHNEGTQPSIRAVTTALDQERIALREALGYGAPHFPLADHYTLDGDEWMYGNAAHEKLTDSGDWREKIDLKTHRYMREDTALGLSMLVSIGRWLGTPTPVASGLLAMASAITGEDLYASGRTLESLGLDRLDRKAMADYLHHGPGANDHPRAQGTGRARIGAIGAGRMGRGIAVAFALAGHEVALIDIKPRDGADAARLAAEAMQEIERDLVFLKSVDLIDEAGVASALQRVAFADRAAAPGAIAGCDLLFEGVPETVEAKRACFAFVGEHVRDDAIIASTTSTIDAETLAPLVRGPERFLNAHWLNPAYLMPLVEISPSACTAPEIVDRLRAIMTAIGKVPINCAASPGYIVPRIQALAMNEAARMAEEGVASPDEIDMAVRVGFGLRFAVLGLLEFIDWGGGDILHHASAFLSDKIDHGRFAAPAIIGENMARHRRGLRDGAGFYDYAGVDLDAYRTARLSDFVAALRQRGLLPVVARAAKPVA